MRRVKSCLPSPLFVALTLLLASCATPDTSRELEIEAIRGAMLTSRDVSAITKLAAKLDMGPIVRIFAADIDHPDPCYGALAYEQESVKGGAEIRQRHLRLYLDRGERKWSTWCGPLDFKKRISRDGWVTSAREIKTLRTWRFFDGEWSVDVALKGVDYRYAAEIVRAFRQGSVRMIDNCSLPRTDTMTEIAQEFDTYLVWFSCDFPCRQSVKIRPVGNNFTGECGPQLAS